MHITRFRPVGLSEATERARIVYRHLVRTGMLRFSQLEQERIARWAEIHIRTRKPEAIVRHYRPVLDRLDTEIWKLEHKLEMKLDEKEQLDKRIKASIIPHFIISGRWKGLAGLELEEAIKRELLKHKCEFSYRPVHEVKDIIMRLSSLDISSIKKAISQRKKQRLSVANSRRQECAFLESCTKDFNDPGLGMYYRLALMELHELKVFLYDGRQHVENASSPSGRGVG